MNSSHHWRIILNPRAGRNRASKQRGELEKLLAESAACYDIVATSASGDTTRLAREAVAEGISRIAAAGGDGTLGEVLNGVMPNSEISLAVLPLGTGNDFARCLGIPNLRDAVETMLRGEAKHIDVGEVRTHSHQRFFLNVAGCGFDAVVARCINDGKLLRGTPAYVLAVLQTLRGFRPTKVRLNFDEETVETRALLCAVANATSYGGGMKIAPRAELDDGLFDICLIGDATRTEFLRAFPSVFKGAHESHAKVRTWRVRNIKIESEVPLPVLADGELVGTTPAQFTIWPRAVTMMVPATSSAAAKTALET